ncbi:hypothetical protein [Flavobacterium sp.]|uniref:hypothetical protein n=1 Tax=Flavobacterium sp. TaxID=239 RepID=UPI003BEE8537
MQNEKVQNHFFYEKIKKHFKIICHWRSFCASGVVPTNTIIPSVSQPPCPIPSGGQFYSGIHTHPNDCYPMFSWSDVNVLNDLENGLASFNQEMSSLLLVCQDGNGVFQTYALVFDSTSMNGTIDQFLMSPENAGLPNKEICSQMDEKLGKYYENDSNSERAFLRFMSSSNVSLYKANATLTNWSKLYLSNNSPTATVKSKGCN